MVEPASSWVSGESPLAAASASTLSPSWAAIDDRDSPLETTWTKYAEAVAGTPSMAPAATVMSRESRKRMRPSVVNTTPNRNRCNRRCRVQNRVQPFRAGRI